MHPAPARPARFLTFSQASHHAGRRPVRGTSSTRHLTLTSLPGSSCDPAQSDQTYFFRHLQEIQSRQRLSAARGIRRTPMWGSWGSSPFPSYWVNQNPRVPAEASAHEPHTPAAPGKSGQRSEPPPFPPPQVQSVTSKTLWPRGEPRKFSLASRSSLSFPMLLQRESVPAESQAYLATSCGPCLSCLRRQHPATHGRPLVFGHGPPSHVCPLEKESSDLDCPSLPFGSSRAGGFSILCAQCPSLSGGGLREAGPGSRSEAARGSEVAQARPVR